MAKLKIEYWPIGEVTPYENNPRDNDGSVEPLANSIREFGWRQPIVVDADGVVIAGHTRLKAARLLGLDEVPVHVATDLTPAQAQAYRIADNSTSDNSEWDWSKLEEELDGLSVDFDMEDFGLDMRGFGLAGLERGDVLNSSEEIDVESFNDDKFEHECPRCGFRFNE